jgi:hypothetical protein
MSRSATAARARRVCACLSRVLAPLDNRPALAVLRLVLNYGREVEEALRAEQRARRRGPGLPDERGKRCRAP